MSSRNKTPCGCNRVNRGGAAVGQMRGRQGPDHEESKRRESPARTAKAQKELRMYSDIVEHA